MPTAPPSSAAPIYRLYTALTQSSPFDPNSGLGGKLLYAGEITPVTRNLLQAANIAGAASLAASADPATLREAMRNGVIDFLVNSLEEALRILKNEIRKHQTVSVGVVLEPNSLVSQMLDRGVLPDLIPQASNLTQFLTQGSKQIAEAVIPPESYCITWQVDRDFAHWLPRLDECAKAVLPLEDHPRHRWLRLAPRYLGRPAQRQHSIAFTEDEFAKFQTLVKEKLAETGPGSAESPKATIEKIDF
jgi:hypothetical protein